MNNSLKKTAVKLAITTGLSFSILSLPSIQFVQPVFAAASETSAEQIISTGKQYLGVPYEFGAKSGRTNAFDCSSFVQYVYNQHDVDLPRSSRQQAKSGSYISKKDLLPGDLIFSDTNRDDVINHVSIYIGNDQLLHTYRKGIGVAITDFSGSIWDRTYVTARRVIENTPTEGTKATEDTEGSKPTAISDEDTESSPRNSFFSHWNDNRFYNSWWGF